MEPDPRQRPRILVVTPEMTFLHQGMRQSSRVISARACGLGDICANQIHALRERGLDVHIAMPDYRNIFKKNSRRIIKNHVDSGRHVFPESDIHLAQDRSFYYHSKLFLTPDWENIQISLAFQREVIYRIIPEVKPDLIHCYDWMTGLIPAMVHRLGIPTIFSLYRLDSPRLLLSVIEDRGIDAASFWQYCYYSRLPANYHETRQTNPVDFLASGVFASHMVTMLSRTFLKEVVDEKSHAASDFIKSELNSKLKAGRLRAVAPAPDPSFDPTKDLSLIRSYGPATHPAGKIFNKLQIQEILNLKMDSTIPLCFWPTRLDGNRPGCRLMAETLGAILDRYRDARLQIAFIADGDYQHHIRSLIDRFHAWDRLAVCDFDPRRYRLAYGAADFVLMPTYQDPCALPCRIGQRYGALPIGYDAGAVHDCVKHLNVSADTGSGFLFENFDANGFLWGIRQAMDFFNQPDRVRSNQIERIMTESLNKFNADASIKTMIDIYGEMLSRNMDNLTGIAEASSQIAA
jgi:starch synthase